MAEVFKAYGARVLVRPVYVDEKFQGTVIVRSVETSKKDEHAVTIGKVVDIGPNCGNMVDGDVVDFAVGDVVCFRRYAGFRLENPNNKEDCVIVLNEEDLLAKCLLPNAYTFREF